ncbi:hypothetical protein B0T25DRAFT_287101 [Lasiosphaeria hispida]|uniref:Transmembrane protein n=1 Tax=Lasiosphaeria hispida TaxID=260671 RepID=A0AAJ0MAY0_9PEZI|nr:hypothetical protein B0T25DRAFT_287101 [Lasiosphaeria hispida]
MRGPYNVAIWPWIWPWGLGTVGDGGNYLDVLMGWWYLGVDIYIYIYLLGVGVGLREGVKVVGRVCARRPIPRFWKTGLGMYVILYPGLFEGARSYGFNIWVGYYCLESDTC